MKHINTLKLTLTALALTASSALFAATYTAVATGDWTNTATWSGGLAPGTTINADDDIIINSGITVSMDSDVTFNGLSLLIPGSSLVVNGTLQSANGSALYMNNGDLTGSGTLNLDELRFSGFSSFNFTGSSDVLTLVTSNIALTVVSTVNVADSLILSDGVMSLGTGGSLDLGTGSNVVVDNGSLTTSGGIFSSTNAYNLIYIGTSKTTGIEATGSGLTDVHINLDDNLQNLTLTANLLSGTGALLMHEKGNIELNGMGLWIRGDYQAMPGVSIMGDPLAEIRMRGLSEPTSSLEFMPGRQELNDFYIEFFDLMPAYGVTINTDLTIHGELSLVNGNLNIDGASTLTMAANSHIIDDYGDIVVINGGFDGSNSYDLTYVGPAKNTGLELTGPGLDAITVDLDSIHHGVYLTQDYTSNGTIVLQKGRLDLASHILHINGGYMSTPEGFFAGDLGSSLNLNMATSTDTLSFFQPDASVDNLTLNLGDSSDVVLGSDLFIGTSLNLNSGSLVLQDDTIDIIDGAFITGADQNNYIKIKGDGLLNMWINGPAYGIVTFPIGTENNYSPAHIEMTTITSAKFLVNVMDGVLMDGTSGTDLAATRSLVDRTWNIYTEFVDDSMEVDVTLNWDAAAEVNGFDRTDAYISNYIAGEWDMYPSSSASMDTLGMYEMTRTALSDFGPFIVTDRNAALSVEEAQNLVSGLYPNPTQEFAYINLTESMDAVIDLMDLSGKILMSTNSNGNQTNRIDLSSLPSGVYLVKVTADNQTVVKRVVKS